MFSQLVDAASAAVRNAPASAGFPAEELAVFAAGMKAMPAEEDLPPRRHGAVEANIERALALAEAGGQGDLARAVRASLPLLHWADSTNTYQPTPELQAFLDGYTYCGILAPKRMEGRRHHASPDILFGLSLQGPGLFYPGHAHKAVEYYYVIGGTGEWKAGDNVWKKRPPGSFMRHPPFEDHAMRTSDEPLLTFFAWVSDLDSNVYLT